MDAEFFNGQSLGVASNLNSSPSGILSETFKLDDPKYAGSPLAFTWGDGLIMPIDGTITPPQTIRDPSTLLAQELIQRSNTRSPAIFPPENSSSFMMTCPLPLCSHQSNELISIWRHITWEHLGHNNHCSKAMTELVEKVIFAGGGKQ
jgi:hypothetical protein